MRMHEKICKILAKYNTFQIAVHNWKIYISCAKMPKLVKVVARLLRANQIGPISASVSDETFEPRFYQHLHWNRTSPGERDSNEMKDHICPMVRCVFIKWKNYMKGIKQFFFENCFHLLLLKSSMISWPVWYWGLCSVLKIILMISCWSTQFWWWKSVDLMVIGNW